MRKLRALIAIGGASAGLAACTDQPTSAPIVRPMARVNADALPACDFSALRAAVRAYADVNGNDVIFGYIQGMSTDPYGQGMKGLARIADIRANGPKKAGAGKDQAAAAITGFLACMSVGQVQTGFATNIKSAVDSGGLFEVPHPDSTYAIFSRGVKEGVGTKFWAAKPAGGATWGSLTGGLRYVVFGYKVNGENGFDYNVVPMLGTELGAQDMPVEFSGDLIIGACGSFGTSTRVLHVDDVLADQDMSFCLPKAPSLAFRSSGFGSDLALLVRRGLSVFAPQTGYAYGGGVGGAVSELSPADLQPVTPTITYTKQPLKTPAVGDSLGVRVSLTSGTSPSKPLVNVVVTLAITGNSGLNALFLDPLTNKRCYFIQRTTDTQGLADFHDVPLLKSGGYTLTATATFDGLVAAPKVSDPVNVKNNNKYVAPTATCTP